MEGSGERPRPKSNTKETARTRYVTDRDGNSVLVKRTKTRSKQKNLKRDTRPAEKKPNFNAMDEWN